MRSDEWNERLFAELVVAVGSEGDPLYLYVDDDVLAKCTDGVMEPQEALEDFRQSFNTTDTADRLKRAARQAREWRAGGYVGTPPYIDALAMTVLAATLSPIGASSSNVYGRQRWLFGMADTGAGIPPGYEDWVPVLWRAWNSWLANEGARFGTSTASAEPPMTNQGWARSQSFIRTRDKHDVYEFFESSAAPLQEMSAEQLLEGLTQRLRKHSQRNPKLLARSVDLGYRDEFLAYLPRSLSFWNKESVRATRSQALGAKLLWDKNSFEFDLVVELRSVSGIVGEEVQLVDSSTFTIAAEEKYLYVFGNVTDPILWFSDALVAWPLNSRLTVSWTPRRAYLMEFEALRGWVETTDFSANGQYRILCEDELLLQLEALGVTGRSHTSPIEDWSWIDSPGIPSDNLDLVIALLEISTEARQPRLTGLMDGLPLGSGNIFLESGEPDVVVTTGIPTSIRVDGVERLLDLPSYVDGQGFERYPISLLALDPGTHQVEIVVEGQNHAHSLRIEAPRGVTGRWLGEEAYLRLAEREPSGEPVGWALVARTTTSQSLLFRRGAAAFAVLNDGTTYEIGLDASLPAWVTRLGLTKAGDLDSLLEIQEVRPSAEAQKFTLLYRSGRSSQWRAIDVSLDSVSEDYPATRVRRLSNSTPELVDFIVSDKVDSTCSSVPLPKLRQAVMNSLASSPPPRSPRNALRGDYLPVRPRNDIELDPTTSNPFEDFLEWMSELSDGYCSLPKAQRVFEWLWVKSFPGTDVPHFTLVVLQRLQDLGHVHVEKRRRRIWVAPTVLSNVPNGCSLRALAGSRPIEFLDRLRMGDDEAADGPSSDLLQNLTFHRVRQSDASGRPMAPDNVLIQVAVNVGCALDAPAASQYEELAIWTEPNLSSRLIGTIPTMAQRVDGRNQLDVPPRARFYVWQPSLNYLLGGTWRVLDTFPPPNLQFVRISVGFSHHYGWWSEATGLSDVGWTYGRWLHESHHRDSQLVLFQSKNRQLMVPDALPLPSEVSKALAARTGFLPRLTAGAVAPPHRRAPRVVYRLFENVSQPFAERVVAVLGQSGGAAMTITDGVAYG